MKDRFKFRVFNTKEQCVDHMWSDEPLIDGLRGVAMYYDGFANGNYEIDDCIIEQCTGLKDKNGRLIYEGDIVRWHRNKKAGACMDMIGSIYFSTGAGYGFYFHGDPKIGRLSETHGLCGIIHRVEVIGNIHENAELLK